MKRHATLLMYLLLVLIGAFAEARILDTDNDALVPVLKDKAFDQCLDDAGIDILLGDQIIDPQKALLRPLSNYYPTGQFDWSRLHKGTWEKGFLEGVVGVLLARQSTASCAETTDEDCKELKEWMDAPEDRRMFISFTRDDHSTAMKLRNCLQNQQFVVVTYLNEARDLRYRPEITGELFAITKPQNRLVIDSLPSRRSGGIALEAMCGCEDFLLKLLSESKANRDAEP